MAQIKNSIFAALLFGLLFGLYSAFTSNAHNALIAGPISGLAFGIATYLFTTSKTVKRQTQIKISSGETIIYSGGANHFINGEAVGGKLYLLANKIQFQSHGFNFQNHGLIIDLQKVKNVTFYNTLGLVPNGLAISTTDGQTEKFVVSGRQLWKDEIEKLILYTQSIDISS
ncbi:MAG: hypothetical protein P0Y49_05915 [Candidatus Pedobacter colombiensis]|uniref:GRAM domain-containing protein n=1 Tax=Candidatus Pedobacter colombiensis TaxID=3121371 RepID=A0AAJ6B9X6_9SPHI|nr:hypothetical protein [Pedobacter sp.]WEK20673.1 MAG: hypothetical protein P0Y49_05915 [Pedobacter sp.]